MPIVAGYLPIGFGFGLLAVQTGLSPWEVAAMSLFVYAGASQFAAVGLIGSGVGPWAVIAATFLVNLRHLLMTAALSPYLRGTHRAALAGLAFLVTDETFAVGVAAGRRKGDLVPGAPMSDTRSGEKTASQGGAGWLRAGSGGMPWFLLGLNVTAYGAWVAGSVSGALLGSRVVDPAVWGLDFALPALFIALVVLLGQGYGAVLVAVSAALVSLATILVLPAGWNVIAATIAAATLGVMVQRWTGKSS